MMAGVTVFRQLSRLRGVSLTLLKENIMPSANRMTTPVAVDEAQIEGRYAPLGGYTVSFETFRQDADPAPYFLEKAGVALTDGAQCGQAGRGFGRLNFALPRPILQEAIRRISAAMPS